MATWIVHYSVSSAYDEKRGHHFEVASVNNRDTRKVVHRYKSKDDADLIREALNSKRGAELS